MIKSSPPSASKAGKKMPPGRGGEGGAGAEAGGQGMGESSAAEPSGGGRVSSRAVSSRAVRRWTCQQPAGWRKFNGAGESANKCKGLAQADGGNRAKAGRNARACTFAEGGRDETSLPNDRKPRPNTPITIDGSGCGRICCRPELARVGSKRPQPTDGNG